jgi:peptide/nickel transport system permease protein
VSFVAPIPRLRRLSVKGRATRTGLGVIGNIALVMCILFVLLALFGPLIAPYNPNSVNLNDAFVGPLGGHLLGFDESGRDLLSRLFAGARTSLLGPAAVVAIATSVGIVLGISSAWFGGWYDATLGSILNVIFAFPGILLAVLAVAVFGAGLPAAVLALAIAYTPYLARGVRAGAVSEAAKDYIAALRVQGLSGSRICFRHFLPNVLPLVVAQAISAFAYATVDLAAISFLGLGVQQPQSDWGLMVASGQQGVVEGYPTEAIAAGICLVLAVLSFSVLGDRLLARNEARAR